MLLIINWTNEKAAKFQPTSGSTEIPCVDREDGIAKGRAFLREHGMTHENITRARFVVRDSFLSMIAPALSPSVKSDMVTWAKKQAA